MLIRNHGWVGGWVHLTWRAPDAPKRRGWVGWVIPRITDFKKTSELYRQAKGRNPGRAHLETAAFGRTLFPCGSNGDVADQTMEAANLFKALNHRVFIMQRVHTHTHTHTHTRAYVPDGCVS